MKQKNLNAKNKIIHSKASFFLKAFFSLSIFLTMAFFTKAQHCEGCSVDINGPAYVYVGDTITYTCMPSAPSFSHTSTWDFINFLEGYATIVDQGTYSNGEEWITLYFHTRGYPWFTFQADYQGFQDFDELALTIQ